MIVLLLNNPTNNLKESMYPFEFYELPTGSQEYYHPVEREMIDFEGRIDSFYFSPHLPRSMTPPGQTQHTLPPPISLYFRLEAARRLMHVAFWPQRTPQAWDAPTPAARRYAYALARRQVQSNSRLDHRALVCEVPRRCGRPAVDRSVRVLLRAGGAGRAPAGAC